MSVFKINLLLCATLFCWFPASSGAQQLKCDAVRPLPGSPSSYKNRGNRCEGLYVADVGAHSIDVVSFTSGRLTYDIGSKMSLRVSASSQAPAVNIRAVAIPPRTYYRMDTVLRSGLPLIWPVADVLLPEKLTDNRIGIFAWTGTENSKTFVPARVAPDKAGQRSPRLNPILLTIQLSFDAEAIKWRWARVQGGRCAAFDQWQDAAGQAVKASRPVQINLQRVPARFGCVEIAARSRDKNEWATLPIRVEIPER